MRNKIVGRVEQQSSSLLSALSFSFLSSLSLKRNDSDLSTDLGLGLEVLIGSAPLGHWSHTAGTSDLGSDSARQQACYCDLWTCISVVIVLDNTEVLCISVVGDINMSIISYPITKFSLDYWVHQSDTYPCWFPSQSHESVTYYDIIIT